MSETPKAVRLTRQQSSAVIRALLSKSIFNTTQPKQTVLIKRRILIGTFRRFKRKPSKPSKAIRRGPLKLIESLISRKTSVEEVFSKDVDAYVKFTNPVSFIRRGAVIPTCQLRKVVSSLRKSGVFIRCSDQKRVPKEFSQVKLVRKRIEPTYIKGSRGTIGMNPLIKRLAMRKNC